MANKYIIRLISSQDHPANSKNDLLEHIRATGTDRYDKHRKQLFDEFYKDHHVDFFGMLVDQDKIGKTIQSLKQEFSEKAMGDRGQAVVPDIAIVYKAKLCEMIQNVYRGKVVSDCFRFKVEPKEALESVLEI